MFIVPSHNYTSTNDAVVLVRLYYSIERLHGKTSHWGNDLSVLPLSPTLIHTSIHQRSWRSGPVLPLAILVTLLLYHEHAYSQSHRPSCQRRAGKQVRKFHTFPLALDRNASLQLTVQ